MEEKYLISFSVKDPEEIMEATDNISFVSTSGYPEIIVDGINITENLKKEALNSEVSGRVIEFAVDLLLRIPQILKGEEGIKIPYNENQCIFTFNRCISEPDFADIIKCTVNDGYSIKAANYPTTEFCIDILYAAKNLEKQMKKNENSKNFSMYQIFDQLKHDAMDSMKANRIISDQVIKRIFIGKKVNGKDVKQASNGRNNFLF